MEKNPIEIIIKAFAAENLFVSRAGVVLDPDTTKTTYAKLLVEIGHDFYHIIIRKGEYVGD